MKQRRYHVLAMAAVVLIFSQNAPVKADDDFVGSLRLEYWNYGMKGNATVKGSSVDLEDTNKVINGNNHGFTVLGERSFDSWGLLFDLYFGKQNGTKQLSESESVDWDFQSSMLTAGGYLSLLNKESEQNDSNLRLDGMLGIRSYMNTYKLEFLPFDPVNDKDQSDYVGWIDPYLGLRLKSALNEKWSFELYGDAGGFGIGSASELSVLTRAAIVWSVTPGFNLIGGYRLFDLKSGDQSGDRRTVLDLQMRGPTLGIEGRF